MLSALGRPPQRPFAESPARAAEWPESTRDAAGHELERLPYRQGN
jgi:hypothetical protein